MSEYDPIIDTYYELRARFGGRPRPNFRRSAVRGATAYVAWCERAGIDDPLLFLRYRFECAQYTGYQMTWPRLRSNRLALVWQEWREGHALADVAAERLKAEAGTPRKQAIKTLRVLTRSMVEFQGRHLGRAELCAVEVQFSGGYHPESRHCPACPAAVRCAANLYQAHGFDVVALRTGRLHALPADVAAAAVG